MKYSSYLRGWTVAMCTAFLPVLSAFAQTEPAYPSKPIHLVIPSARISTSDIVARSLHLKFGEAFGQTLVAERELDAETDDGSAFVAKAEPDGYTLLLGSTQNAVNASLYKKMPYDLLKDFAPVILIGTTGYVLVVNPSLHVQSVGELIALAKSEPDKLTYASDGVGSFSHLCGELFNSLTATKIVHVPYKGPGPAMIDLLAGRVTMYFSSLPAALPFIRNSELRALGVTSPKRPDLAPDLQTLAEAGVPGYDLIGWYGVLAPAGTPKEIISTLNAEIDRVINLPDFKAKPLLVSQGIDTVGGSPEAFGEFLRNSIAGYRKIVERAHIVPVPDPLDRSSGVAKHPQVAP
jgi:tripartite-type tricarboxylate transporter receptor subunit TctC